MKFMVCEICGNLVCMLEESGVPLMCCGQEMTEVRPGTTDGAEEKHVPIIAVDGNLVKVKVGSIAHPMEEGHFIAWIQIETAKGMQRSLLYPGGKPFAEFLLTEGDTVQAAYAWCNLHGLWKGELL